MERRIEDPDISEPFQPYKKEKVMFNLNNDDDEEIDGNLIDDDSDSEEHRSI